MPIYEKIIPFVVAAISTSKGLSKIKTDFSDAINEDILSFWEKVKPIFIKEDSQATALIEENIQNASEEKIKKAEKDIEYVARKAIENEDNKAEIESAMEKLIQKFPTEDAAIKIIGSHNNTIVNSTVSNSFNQPKS